MPPKKKPPKTIPQINTPPIPLSKGEKKEEKNHPPPPQETTPRKNKIKKITKKIKLNPPCLSI
jgi:hypothetical protein